MDKQTPSLPNGKHNEAPKPPDDNSIRWFLVKCTVVLMFFDLAIYLIARDVNVLINGTLLGIAVAAIFAFYFPRK